MLVHEAGKVAEDREVEFDCLGDVGTLDLHGHHRSVLQHRGVDLRHRSASDRHVVEGGEEIRNRAAEFVGDDLLCLLGGESRDVRLELHELEVIFIRHQVAARTDDLAKLDECRPKFLQREAHAFGKRLREDAGLVKSDRGILDAEHALECDQLPEHPQSRI